MELEPPVGDSLIDGSLVALFEQMMKLTRKLVIGTPGRARRGSVLETIKGLLNPPDWYKNIFKARCSTILPSIVLTAVTAGAGHL